MPKAEPSALPAPLPTRAELAAAFSQALDLAEGREPGHSARVCYVAGNLADALELKARDQRAVYYGSLLHDAGAAPATSEVCRLLNLSEDALFAAKPGLSPQQLGLELAPFNAAAVAEALRSHPDAGVQIARQLGFDEPVRQTIATHHERWDGKGYPHALKGKAIPVAGRVVAAADLIESLIAAEQNTLAARRNLLAGLAEHRGSALEPAIADASRELVRQDEFWLGLHDHDTPAEMAALCPGDQPERTSADLITFATVFAALADAKGEHTEEHSERTAAVADEIGGSLNLPADRRELLRIAGLLHDVGLLGVPARVIAKPDILSLSEMEAMRKHPTYSQMVLEDLPGLKEVARWVGAHHERPDGRGYPEMLDDKQIAPEARILAIADTYVALTSVRPYRGALSEEDAQQVLLGGAGTQLDPKLVQLFYTRSIDVTSSRTARRSRRKR